MKTILILAVIGLSVSSALAVPFSFRYTFNNGSRLVGTFDGEKGDIGFGEEVLDVQNLKVEYFPTRISTESIPVWADLVDSFVPPSGSQEKLYIWLLKDNPGSDEYPRSDEEFEILDGSHGPKGFVYFSYVVNKEAPRQDWETSSIYEPDNGSWRLFSIYTVPDGGSSLLMLSTGIIGAAGFRRVRKGAQSIR